MDPLEEINPFAALQKHRQPTNFIRSLRPKSPIRNFHLMDVKRSFYDVLHQNQQSVNKKASSMYKTPSVHL